MGNKLAKFHGNILSLSENIAKNLGGLSLFDSHCMSVCLCKNGKQLIRRWCNLLRCNL